MLSSFLLIVAGWPPQSEPLCDGARYLGLSFRGQRAYAYSMVPGTKPSIGSEETTYDRESGHYTVKRSGGLAAHGDEKFEVRGDGVYLVEIQDGELKRPMLSIPSELPIKCFWNSSLSVGVLQLSISNVILREESVQTKAGKFQTLLVCGDGTISVEGQSQKIVFKTWYAKDIGAVKMRIRSESDAGMTTTQSTELIKLVPEK